MMFMLRYSCYDAHAMMFKNQDVADMTTRSSLWLRRLSGCVCTSLCAIIVLSEVTLDACIFGQSGYDH